MREFREQICEAKRHELQTAEDRLPLARLKVWAEAIEPSRGITELLAQKGERPVVIADVSPAERWQGGVVDDFVPSEWARSLLAHPDVRALALPSAASIARGELPSELDEFSGWLEPRLVRDFVIDEYQIY